MGAFEEKRGAAKVGGFLWRYMWARYRCMGGQPPPSERRLVQQIEDGVEDFAGEIVIEADAWPPITNDARHHDLLCAIVKRDDTAMPGLVDLAEWRNFVFNNGPIPRRREPEPASSFRDRQRGQKLHDYFVGAEPDGESPA